MIHKNGLPETCAHLKAQDTILVTAAAGGLGHLTVQIAKRTGAHVIALCSNEEKAQFLHDLACCDLIINYKDEDYNQILSQRYPLGIDVIWETIGGTLFRTLAGHLAPKGRLVSLGAVSTYATPELREDVTLATSFYGHGRKLLPFSVTRQSKHFREFFQQLCSMYLDGHVQIICDLGSNSGDGQFSDLLGIVRAVEHLGHGKSFGKVIASLNLATTNSRKLSHGKQTI